MQVAHGNFSHRSFASNLKDDEACDIVTDEGTGGALPFKNAAMPCRSVENQMSKLGSIYF
jgi:hypothetical protein